MSSSLVDVRAIWHTSSRITVEERLIRLSLQSWQELKFDSDSGCHDESACDQLAL